MTIESDTICYDKNTDIANIRIYKLVYADEFPDLYLEKQSMNRMH